MTRIHTYCHFAFRISARRAAAASTIFNVFSSIIFARSLSRSLIFFLQLFHSVIALFAQKWNGTRIHKHPCHSTLDRPTEPSWNLYLRLPFTCFPATIFHCFFYNRSHCWPVFICWFALFFKAQYLCYLLAPSTFEGMIQSIFRCALSAYSRPFPRCPTVFFRAVNWIKYSVRTINYTLLRNSEIPFANANFSHAQLCSGVGCVCGGVVGPLKMNYMNGTWMRKSIKKE